MYKKLLLLTALMTLPLGASAATYYADTDGDGYTDTITTITSGSTGISIYHPRTGTTSFYSITGSFSVFSIVDTNGIAGDDIIVIRPTGVSSTNGVSVIHDQNKTISTYSLNPNVSFSVTQTADTNGLPGAEIIIARYAPSSLYASVNGVTIIDDRANVKRHYTYNMNVPYSIFSVADTNGQPGAEIVVDRHASSSLYAGENGISIIDDRANTTRLYGITLSAGFSVRNVADYDGIAGAEVCYNTNNPFQYIMIVDRTQTRVGRTGC